LRPSEVERNQTYGASILRTGEGTNMEERNGDVKSRNILAGMRGKGNQVDYLSMGREKKS